MIFLINAIAWMYAHQLTLVAVFMAFVLGGAASTVYNRGWRGFMRAWFN